MRQGHSGVDAAPLRPRPQVLTVDVRVAEGGIVFAGVNT